MEEGRVFFNSYYPGGSSNGISGLLNNAIYSWKADNLYFSLFVTNGIGPIGIAGFAFDWEASGYHLIFS